MESPQMKVNAAFAVNGYWKEVDMMKLYRRIIYSAKMTPGIQKQIVRIKLIQKSVVKPPSHKPTHTGGSKMARTMYSKKS